MAAEGAGVGAGESACAHKAKQKCHWVGRALQGGARTRPGKQADGSRLFVHEVGRVVGGGGGLEDGAVVHDCMRAGHNWTQ